MDAQQIKDLIDSKIAGQGTMVDAGGALPTILKAIVDLAGGQGTAKKFIPADIDLEEHYFYNYTREQAAEIMRMNPERMDDVIDGNVPIVRDLNTLLQYCVSAKQSGGIKTVYFFRADPNNDPDMVVPIVFLSRSDDGKYTFNEV